MELTIGSDEQDEELAELLSGFLRVLLTAVHGLLAAQLPANTELLHVLLIHHQAGLLDQLRPAHPACHQLLDNLQAIAAFVTAQLDVAAGSSAGQSQQHAASAATSWRSSPAAAPLLPVTHAAAPLSSSSSSPSLDEATFRRLVAKVVASPTWRPPANLLALPGMQFEYGEEASPEQFMLPYAWSLALEGSAKAMAWNRNAVSLFDAIGGQHSKLFTSPLQVRGGSKQAAGISSLDLVGANKSASTWGISSGTRVLSSIDQKELDCFEFV